MEIIDFCNPPKQKPLGILSFLRVERVPESKVEKPGL